MVAYTFNLSRAGWYLGVQPAPHIPISRVARTKQKDPILKYKTTNLGAGEMALAHDLSFPRNHVAINN